VWCGWQVLVEAREQRLEALFRVMGVTKPSSPIEGEWTIQAI
jgi:hypothetical protein